MEECELNTDLVLLVVVTLLLSFYLYFVKNSKG